MQICWNSWLRNLVRLTLLTLQLELHFKTNPEVSFYYVVIHSCGKFVPLSKSVFGIDYLFLLPLTNDSAYRSKHYNIQKTKYINLNRKSSPCKESVEGNSFVLKMSQLSQLSIVVTTVISKKRIMPGLQVSRIYIHFAQ